MAVTYTDLAPMPATPATPTSTLSLRDRLLPPFTGSRLWGWLAPIGVMLLAGYLRFNQLSVPGGKASYCAWVVTVGRPPVAGGAVGDRAPNRGPM